MSASKNINRICIGVLIISILITILFMNGERFGMSVIVDEDAETYTGSAYFTSNDMGLDWDTVDPVRITLSDSEIEINGNGAYSYNGDLVISQTGYYVLAGELTDGSIIVDAYDSSKIWLLFDGVEVSCSDNAAFRIEQADKVFVTLAEGSTNTLLSGSEYSEEAQEDGVGGAIFARDDLTINGSGSLTITGEYKHGIEANDDLVLTGGTINITAAQDGINANDSVRITGTTDLTISAQDDGITVSQENGYFYIENGTLLISECYEGIEATTIDISGGDITIYPTDDGLNANGGSDSFGFGGFGGMGPGGQRGFGAEGTEAGEASEADAAAAEAGTDNSGQEGPVEMPQMTETEAVSEASGDSGEEETWVKISGGTLTIVNETGNDADGIDSNGSIYISGGTIYVSLLGTGSNSALDCGSESGGVCEITGGTIIACGASSMAESFDSSSTQASFMYNISDGVDAGTLVSIENSDGDILFSYEVPCSFTSMVFSCPELSVGESYLVSIGENVEAIDIDEISASFGDAQSGMFGGNMNWGGMGPRSEFGGFGGRGGHRGRNNTEETDSTEASGDTAAGSEAEELPDFEGMPTPPDMDNAEGGMSGPGGREAFNEQAQTDETAVYDNKKALSEFDGTVWLYVGLSVIALGCGIVFSKRMPGRF